MPEPYRAPGVYVEEVSFLPFTIEQVSTGIPAFIGYTQKAEKVTPEDLLLTPTRIDSLLEYETLFGFADDEKNLSVTIKDTTNNRDIFVNTKKTSPYTMHYAMQLFFKNGGKTCYIISVCTYEKGNHKILLKNLKKGLKSIKNFKATDFVVFPDAIGLKRASSYYTLINLGLTQCHKNGSFLILDCYKDDVKTLRTSNELGTGNFLKNGAAYHPFLETEFKFKYLDTDVQINHRIKDENGTSTSGELNGIFLSNLADETSPEYNLSLYNQLKLEIDKKTVILNPAAAVAGIYSRVDNNRGVWKAPANEVVKGIFALTKAISDIEQESLNVSIDGKSINAIRYFPGKKNLIWGARTLAGNNHEWRYVSVIRFKNMIERSIQNQLEKVVFEPNDANLWIQLKAGIENFLNQLWRAGALAGSKPEHAFFVNIGLGSTMTEHDILNYKLKITIGISVIRPAEFIVVSFEQKMLV